MPSSEQSVNEKARSFWRTSISVIRSSLISAFVLTPFRYEAEQQFVNTSQLVWRSGWLHQTRTNTDKVGEQGCGLHLSRIVQNSEPDALQRLKAPRVDPFLDGAYFGV